MSNAQFRIQHGKIVLPKESIDVIKSLYLEDFDKTDILVNFFTSDTKYFTANLFIDEVDEFAEDKESQCWEMEDIFLHHIFLEYHAIEISGHIFDDKGAKYLVKVLYLFSNGFGVYKMYLDPSLN